MPRLKCETTSADTLFLWRIPLRFSAPATIVHPQQLLYLHNKGAKMRQLISVVLGCVSLAVLSPCAGSSTGSPAPTTVAATSTGSASASGQQISVDPTVLFLGCTPSSGTVTASTNFAGAITAAVDSPNSCSVSPGSQDAGGSGGTKRATFTITATNSNGCTVTFTDKKGNTAAVHVVPSVTGSCFI